MARMTQRRMIHRFHLDGSGTEYFSRGHSLNVFTGRERLSRPQKVGRGVTYSGL